MTIYYVSKQGNDASNGLGPDASHASNKPWLTILKAIGATGIASGDTVYIGPGIYREAIAVAMTSAVAETAIIGDPGNSQGFKDGSGVLVAPADVIWTAYTTNDTTAPSGASTLGLAGRDFLTFQTIVFVGGAGTPSVIDGTTTNSVNITFRDCTFLHSGAGSGVGYTGLADVASNWLIDRCIFVSAFFNNSIDLVLPTSALADYDSNFVIQNSIIMGGIIGITITASGALSFKAGGVDALNCTIFASSTAAFRTNSANLSTSIPCTVNNCLIMNQATAISANTSGQITENYCRIQSNTLRNNVSAGANSITGQTHALLLEVGQALFMGRATRPFLAPTSGSPLLGFGSTGAPSVDIENRSRPSGGASTSNAVGARERHEIGTQETSVVQAGASGVKITGPGDHDFQIPVDASSTTISIYVRYDTTHGTGSKPQAILLANGAIGVTAETKTATVGVDTWEQLTFAAQTPTAKGFVTIRCVSRAAAGGGIAYFDTAAGGANGSQGFDYFRQAEPLSALVATAAGGGGAGGGIFHSGVFGE